MKKESPTADIMRELSKAGLVRTTVAQVWNKDNHRVTRVFEYENEKAYKACQLIIEKNYAKSYGQTIILK